MWRATRGLTAMRRRRSTGGTLSAAPPTAMSSCSLPMKTERTVCCASVASNSTTSPLSAAQSQALGGPIVPDPENIPPTVVAGPAGPVTAITGQPVSYLFMAADENEDTVMITVDWGDGSTSASGFRPAGQALVLEHAWAEAGTYIIRARGARRARRQFGTDGGTIRRRSPGRPSSLSARLPICKTSALMASSS